MSVSGDGCSYWGDAPMGLRSLVPQVQEIVFRNFYTAFLSVRVQRAGPGGSQRWVTCLRDLCLMPCPHTEEGSQDYFCLHRHQVSMSGWGRAITQPSGAPRSSPTPRMAPSPGLWCQCPAAPMAVRVPVPCPAQAALRDDASLGLLPPGVARGFWEDTPKAAPS